ncbi:enoyl-CoA hydratase/isomerase family protein [Paraburkholderia caballeronis]|uniref:Enoyl-CoA hydratase/enoyl-CoA hydratase n=1 Tax=Paraburkholderia caballeronis TaxID=416943 RepID=A0A1H7JAE6_9BURK|nr:enoyl-CoA hydratase/isomerase family protein [Paraburkholderia caballeronis]PXW27501.1 enoyl-CoA hydratase/enoyl-CoA hydratase [Paraburkholderia caballeronis]PXX02975.1 enoyl-CoA hydratase/enoyl-CoA hydratase [Paraburkholderia caballeronis]RAK03700.1 enoyl-CoA hydratase/enoyl-CoA hydratase [Paraburkholderia caballeronis]TDV36503.1 enoyl-CoA hydratase/enoyl-CoA hydratase [Paraburkholderia caballeronis]SEC24979.1 enoyl-CoA hydratase/enoyl-CoA hydratase [Paraburkholderia caballeronis]
MSGPLEGVSLSMHGHAALIAMHDEAHRNALSTRQVQAMLDAIRRSRASGARALVIASGIGNFCAGADIREMLNGDWLYPGKAAPDALTPLVLFRALIDDPRPVIAAVDGLALGGGIELLLSADLVLASGNARFAMPELGLGVLPRTALVRLPEIVGRRKALELILTRRRFDVEEAKSIGLVNQIVDGAELVDRALELAQQIAACPPNAVAAVKRRLGRTAPDDWAGIDALLEALDPQEWQEGFSSFLEKRPADYDAQWSKALRAAEPEDGAK